MVAMGGIPAADTNEEGVLTTHRRRSHGTCSARAATPSLQFTGWGWGRPSRATGQGSGLGAVSAAPGGSSCPIAVQLSSSRQLYEEASGVRSDHPR